MGKIGGNLWLVNYFWANLSGIMCFNYKCPFGGTLAEISTAPWLSYVNPKEGVVGMGGSRESCGKFPTEHDLAWAEFTLKFKRIAFPWVLLKLVCQGWNISLVATDPFPESKSPPPEVEDTGQQTMRCLLHDKNAGTDSYFLVLWRRRRLDPVGLSYFDGLGSF